MAAECPALLVAAPASGHGKTTVTAALARLHARLGRRVRVFKSGPDFLDPFWHALASGHPVHNVDLWMTGEADIARRLHDAACESDLILVEAAMGLFDGDPSAADLAERFGLPVVAVIDAAATAETFGAIAHGLRTFRPGLPWAGALANRVAGPRHAEMVQAGWSRAPAGGRWLGSVGRDAAFSLPERHLGLTVASELPDALARLDAAADALLGTPLGRMAPDDMACWRVAFERRAWSPPPRSLAGRRIAVARDAAFCFLYAANLDVLRDLGAEVTFFSPLRDEPVPPSDAAWLPGGYPELHAAALGRARRTRESLRAHVERGRPVWAECGGMIPLYERLVVADGASHAMWGLLPGQVAMQKRLAAIGPQQWCLPDGTLRGHTFHYSVCETPLVPAFHAEPARQGGSARQGEAIYRDRGLLGSYFHAWFASCPEATAAIFSGAAPGG